MLCKELFSIPFNIGTLVRIDLILQLVLVIEVMSSWVRYFFVRGFGGLDRRSTRMKTSLMLVHCSV